MNDNSSAPVPDSPVLLGTMAILTSLVSIYVNLVFLRTSFRSTLLVYTLRKLIRLFTFVHILVAIWTSITICGTFVSHRMEVTRLLVTVYVLLRAPILSTPFWVVVERYFYNVTPCMREKPRKLCYAFGRFIMIIIPVMASASMCFFLKNEDHLQLLTHSTFVWINGSYTIASIPSFFVVAWIVRKKTIALKSASGLDSNERRLKLKLESQMVIRLLVPIIMVSCALTLIETFSAYLTIFGEEWRLAELLLTNSFRLLLMPLSYSIFNSGIREDFFSNFVLWRKAQRRLSESRVHRISRESQEAIITNFKMIGILADEEPFHPPLRKF